MLYTILVRGKYYSHSWSGSPIEKEEEMEVRKALYCYAIGDDGIYGPDGVYRTTDEDVIANSTVVDAVPDGAKHSKLYIVDGKVSK